MEKVTYLFFTDDLILFYKLNEKVMFNLKCVLLSFQAVSSLNINLTKSEFGRLNDREDATRHVRWM